MKRVLILTVTMIYFLCSTGWALTVNFCGNQISTVSFDYEKDNCCCKSKPVKKDCCKQNKQLLKIRDTHKPQAGIKALFVPVTGTLLQPPCSAHAYSFFVPAVKQARHTPPDRVAFCCLNI